MIMTQPDSQNLCVSPSPLAGKKILVTRPGQQAEDLANKLRSLDAEPVLMPLIEICEPDSWHELDTAITNIDKYQWLLFASSNAVISFVTRLKYRSRAAAINKLPNIAVIGETTAQTAKSLSLTVSYCPDNFIAEDFIAQFPGYPNNLKNTKILWPRTNYGRDFIANKLEAAGAAVQIVPAYKTELPGNSAELSKQLEILIRDKKIDAIILASKQTAINLAKIIDCDKLKGSLQGILIVTIGPETSKGALNYLGKVDKEAKQHSAEGIIDALIEHYK